MLLVFILAITCKQLEGQTKIDITYLSIDSAKYKVIDNQGIYGGEFNDIAFSHTTSRIFAGLNSLTSLYYTDDTANTWHSAFEKDSLYNGKGSGWIGSVDKVLTNDSGWVLAHSANREMDIFSSQISFSNGDSGSWKTAMNKQLLQNSGYLGREVSAITLTNYHAYVALGNYIVVIDKSNIDSTDIIDISKQGIAGIDSSFEISSIAVANNDSGYPMYIVVNNNAIGIDTLLYKYDGTFTQVVCPTNIGKLIQVFLPLQASGDTVFLTANDTSSSKNHVIYKSFDGGLNWNSISYNNANGYMMDVDYSQNWKTQYPASNGIVLIIPYNAYSLDMGITWDSMASQFKGIAFSPNNIDFVLACYKKSEIGTNGMKGTLTNRNDIGLNTVTIHQIKYFPGNENYAYAATQVGLGFTKNLTDTIPTYLKWEGDKGKIVAENQEFTALAIDKQDSNHIIAGSLHGFWVSSISIDSLKWLSDTSGFEVDSVIIKDMILIDSIAIAVTASYSSNL